MPASADPGCHDASTEQLCASETGHHSGAYDLNASAFLLGPHLVSPSAFLLSPRLEVGEGWPSADRFLGED